MQPWKVLVQTYLSGAWHYRWTGVAVAWIVCLAGWGIFAFVPNQFEAVAKIYIDTDTLMAPLLSGLTVMTNPDQQVSVMLNTLLTRPNLEQVVRLTSPPGASLSSAEMARQVASLQSHTSLRPLGTKNLYELAFSDKNPNKALIVSQTLISIFVDSNIGTKRKDFQGAQSFLDDKVAEYETLVREAEQRRAAFRLANLDVLSGSASPDAARAEVEKAREDLGAAHARLASLESQLRSIPKVIYVDGPGPLIMGTGGAIGSGGSLIQRLADAKQNLLELQSKYTDDYPDVKAAKRQVSNLEAEVSATPPVGVQASGTESVPNPVYAQTQGKLSDAMTDVAFETHRYNDALASLQNSKNMSSRAIEVNTKFADLDRDYDLVHKTYQDLLARREAARISQAVNDQQSTINVQVIEPPKKAPFPSAPNRPLVNTVILLGGLASGILCTLLLGWNAGRFFVKDQLAAGFDYPIIGVVSRLTRVNDAAKARRAFSTVAVSLVFLICGYVGVLVTFDSAFRGIPARPLMTDAPKEPLNLIERMAKRLSEQESSAATQAMPQTFAERASQKIISLSSPPGGESAGIGPRIAGTLPTSGAAPAADEGANNFIPETAPRPQGVKQIRLDFRALRQNGMITPDNMTSAISNEFRGIKRKLLQKVRDPKTRAAVNNLVMVTSSLPGEGKTFSSINLALSLAAERGLHVLLIDADIIRPSVADMFISPPRDGLTELLSGKTGGISDVLHRCVDIPSLSVIFSGNPKNGSPELISSNQMVNLCRELSTRYPDRVILIDTPPVLASSEAAILSSYVHQVIMIVAADQTDKHQLRKSLDAVSSCHNINLLFNKAPVWSEADYQPYYGYANPQNGPAPPPQV